jgi:ssDNA-binding Zn-finger/Zn-ribbon topoisomerase 1
MSTLNIQRTKPLTAFFACTREGQKVTVPSIAELAKAPKLECPECDGKLVLRLSKYGLFYGCTNYPSCKAAHGAHPDGKPLGKPANKETKAWRIKAHQAFDKLFEGENPLMTRLEAYEYLQLIMNLSQEDAHISKFDSEQCKELIDLLDFNN